MNTSMPAEVDAQSGFDEQYITSSEICRRLQITRVSIMNARKTGFLPDPIEVEGAKVAVWIRSEIEPILTKWTERLNRRGEVNA